MAKIMASRETTSKTLAAVLAVVLAFSIGVILVIKFRKRSNEKFSAENFASTVVSQNPKVFERLAEM
jgi:predicted permease